MKISVVLVRTKYDFNIGMVSRIMANFGLHELILVAPQCEITAEAHHGAAGGFEPLRNRIQVSTWTQFRKLFSEGMLIGFTPKSGTPAGQNDLTPLLEELRRSTHSSPPPTHDHGSRPLYFVFGAEDNGLSTEDLAEMDVRCQLPTAGEFRSMSLSHAVTVALTLANHVGVGCRVDGGVDSKAALTKMEPTPPEQGDAPTWNRTEVEQLMHEWLTKLRFDLSRETNAHRALVSIFRRARMGQSEYELLKKILKQTIRKGFS